MSRSLKRNLLLGTIGAVAVLLILFGTVVYVAIGRALERQFDDALTTAAFTLAAAVQIDDDEVEIDLGTPASMQLQSGQASLRFQFWLDDGTTLLRSESPGQADLTRFAGDLGEPVFRPLPFAADRPGRAVGLRFLPAFDEEYAYEHGPADSAAAGLDEADADSAGRPEIVLVVVGDTTGLGFQKRTLRWLLLIAGAATMAVAWWVCATIVGRGLKPLMSLAGQIEAVREEDLATRIGAADAPTEVRPIVTKLNDLLQRVEAAFHRQRAFTADVAHELRTPLAGIRTTIEVALSGRRDDAEYREALADCLEIAQGMEATGENLLMLARLDAGQTAFKHQTIELAQLIDTCWQQLAQKSKARGVTFDNQIAPTVTCQSDKAGLVTVLTNLLDNAVEYADEKGQVTAAAELAGDTVSITITNTGCTLTSAQVEHVFERFWRADDARKDTGVHCGLGLALVSRIVTSLGGSSVATVDEAGRFAVHIALEAEGAEGRRGQGA